MMFVIELAILVGSILYYILEAIYMLIVPPPAKDIRGKVALVTGGGRGIGRAIAVELAKKGAKLAIWDLDQEVCTEVEAFIRDLGAVCFAYQCDITSVKDVADCAQKVRADMGEVDILVNNAGYPAAKTIVDLTENDVRKSVEVNTTAQYWTVREFLPSMIRRRSGHIAVVVSMAAHMTSSLTLGYSTPKYATNGFCEALADDLRYMNAGGVQLTSIYPTATNTRMLRDIEKTDKVTYYGRFDSELTPEQVGRGVAEGIIRNKRYIFIPGYVSLVSYMALLPLKTRLALKNFTMSGFHRVDTVPKN